MAQNRKDNYQDNDFVEKNEPFKDDLLGREKIAQLWQDTLLKSGKHFVMAVDASWGMGKSYFARNWECKLLHDDYKVCYIDAFEYDFTDDPFMTITSNLIEAFEFTELEEVSNKLNTFFRAFKGHLGAAVPALVGGVVKIVSNIPQIGGIADIGSSLTNAASKAVKEAKNKSMNLADEVLQSDLSYSATMTQFKNKLKELIKKQNSDKPFIVIVDELDRCKPTYAIEFLEKLKHLFNIDNMIFILFINRDELESIIKGRYGQTYDGLNYLNKFIPITVSFPTSLAQNDKLYDSFIKEQISKLSISQSGSFTPDSNGIFVSGFVMDRYSEIIGAMLELIKQMQIKYNLSLRDIKQLFDILDYVNVKHEIDYAVIMFLRIIYLKDLILFKQIKNYSLTDMKNVYREIVSVRDINLMEKISKIYSGSKLDIVSIDILSEEPDPPYHIRNPRAYFNKIITLVETLN